MPLAAANRPNSTLQLIIGNPDTYATTLLAIFVDLFGFDPKDEKALQKALNWHPTTKRMEMEEEIGATMAVINGQKLNVACDLITSDSFFSREDVFVQYCNILSGTPLAVGMFDPADVDECAWGITEALLLAQPDDDEPFAEEILWYIGKVLDDEGIKSPPDVLRIAKREHKPDFSDMSISDPNMFRAEFKVQSDEAAEVEKILRLKLLELLYELEQTPFKNGDAMDLRKRIGQGLRQSSD